VNNKRQHERLELTIPVVLVHEGREIPGTTRNLSAGGMLIDASGVELPYGASVNVRATLPLNQHVLDVVSTVRWIRDGAIGLQFASLRAKDTWALNQLVKILAEAKAAEPT